MQSITTMFNAGDLVYDRRLNKIGMVMRIEEKSLVSAYDGSKTSEAWYHIMLFGDQWCENGKTRGYVMDLANRILESYNPDIHPVPF